MRKLSFRPIIGNERVVFHRSSNLELLMSTTTTENNYYNGMDAYQTLGVPKNADKSAIKAAFRKLIAQWHPDKFPDDEAKKKEGGLRMEKINRAYYILSDDDRRRRYDQYGEQGVGSSAASEEQLRQSGGPGMGGFGDMGGAVDVQDISDIFDAFFGGSGGMRGRSKQRSANAPIAGQFNSCIYCIVFSLFTHIVDFYFRR
jgi:molecular chaperone DnaJ